MPHGEIDTMNTKIGAPLKTRLLTAGALLLGLLAFGPYANATAVRIQFGGAAGSGYADLTLGGTDPADVVDSSKQPLTITGASGTFNGAKIKGLQPLNHAPPPPGELLPASYSLFSIPGYGDHDGVSYDNLFYPSGSPMICLVNGSPVYPFSGGFLDLMGVMFTLDNGDFVDLWSFGVTPPGFAPSWPGGLLYGLKVIRPTIDGYEVLGAPPYATAYVPEPGVAGIFLLGLLLIGSGYWVRRRRLA